MSEGVGGRLRAMLDAAPPAVRPWLEPAGPLGSTAPERLAREAVGALARASTAGRPHGGAFDLLAADAWATWACQAALGADDADAELERVLRVLHG